MSNVIDYFAVLGRKHGPLIPNTFSNIFIGEKRPKLLNPNEIWGDAITDISLIFDDENLPDDTWETIESTVNRCPMLRPHIVFRRRRYSNRQDHIISVSHKS